MTRHVITLAGTLIAVACLTLGSADAEARHCRNRHRNRCCQQINNCGCQQGWNGGYQQATNGCNQSGCQQTSFYASTVNACCTPQATCCSVQPASGIMQPAYVTPTSAGNAVPATPIVSPPAPSPGA